LGEVRGDLHMQGRDIIARAGVAKWRIGFYASVALSRSMALAVPKLLAALLNSS
jgi:hypothetical protein